MTAARYRRALLLLLLLGIAARVGWALWKMHGGLDMNVAAEAFDEARHLAAGQGWAGAYKDDMPTAHLLPIPPLVAGAVYAMLGVATPASELTLMAYATALAIGRIWLFERCFARLGAGPVARLGAVAVLCLLTPYLSHEAITFRTWEGGLAAFVEAGFLLLLLRQLARDPVDAAGWSWTVAVAALLFFINPPLGLAAFACLAVAAWPRRRALPIVRLGLTGSAALALLIGPWAWRNQQAIGHPVLLRSNAGLELALSMNPGALTTTDPRAQFGDRLLQLHPRHSDAVRARMRAMGGEVEYSAALGAETKRWMAAHPTDAMRLMARHLWQQLFPPSWIMETDKAGLLSLGKAAVASTASALGLAGFAWALARRRRWWIYPALLVIVPVGLMLPFQPYHRYIFLLFSPLVFAAADAVEQGWRAVSRRARERTDRPAAAPLAAP